MSIAHSILNAIHAIGANTVENDRIYNFGDKAMVQGLPFQMNQCFFASYNIARRESEQENDLYLLPAMHAMSRSVRTIITASVFAKLATPAEVDIDCGYLLGHYDYGHTRAIYVHTYGGQQVEKDRIVSIGGVTYVTVGAGRDNTGNYIYLDRPLEYPVGDHALLYGGYVDINNYHWTARGSGILVTSTKLPLAPSTIRSTMHYAGGIHVRETRTQDAMIQTDIVTITCLLGFNIDPTLCKKWDKV